MIHNSCPQSLCHSDSDQPHGLGRKAGLDVQLSVCGLELLALVLGTGQPLQQRPFLPAQRAGRAHPHPGVVGAAPGLGDRISAAVWAKKFSSPLTA